VSDSEVAPSCHVGPGGSGIPIHDDALAAAFLSRLFRRLFLQLLAAAHAAGRLAFFGDHAVLADPATFAAFLAPLRKAEWVVYAKKPFGGPQAVLAYLSRYTHRVAISNTRLISADATGVRFKWKDYRIEGPRRYKTMTLPTHEFIRGFLTHVLPRGNTGPGISPWAAVLRFSSTYRSRSNSRRGTRDQAYSRRRGPGGQSTDSARPSYERGLRKLPRRRTAKRHWRPWRRCGRTSILMDIQLPILDGYEVTRRIKADPTFKNVPIIAVTSYALSRDEDKARAAGCDDFVPKPYSPRQLLAKIRESLR
jgi:CheY-like chemotaxis protein